MRKVLFVLSALLIASPAMAVPNVDITCTQDEGGWVTLGYDVTRGAEEPRLRALALDVSVNVGKIVAIRGYKQGESYYDAGPPVVDNRGYGIFPGSVDLTDPLNPVWGDPVSPDDLPGAAGTGIGTQRVILEMGSLYDASVPGNEPPEPTGDLCQLRLTVSSGAVVTVVEEVTHRGGIVMEDPGVVPTTNVGSPTALCAPVWNYTGPNTIQWNFLGDPPYWDAHSQCYGDSDAGDEPFGRGMVDVGMNDVPLLLAGFRQAAFTCDAQQRPTQAWPCNPTDCVWAAADFDHENEVYGRGCVAVGMLDVDVLLANFRNPAVSGWPDCSP
jgi:hypothetical protein